MKVGATSHLPPTSNTGQLTSETTETRVLASRTREPTTRTGETTSPIEEHSLTQGHPKLRQRTFVTRPGGGTAEVRQQRQATKSSEDIPVFDRNKVSLDLPGSLFGPSVSLLINTTKIIGSVIQNSAVRYQTFLRLFRPLFRGPFEIKGLDPPAPTTTTTTTTIPPQRDNEVRR